jgi:hypothetical protein
MFKIIGRYLFNPDHTTNAEAVLTAIAGLLQNIVIICSLGYYRPAWEFGLVVWLMKHKWPDNGE